MILTPQLINHMRRYWRIDEELEKMLLKQLRNEPYPHVYTEQDIYEQSRKMIMRYNENYDNMIQQSGLPQAVCEKPNNDKIRR